MSKIIQAWIDGAIQEIEVEEMTSPEQPLSYDERIDTLENKHEVTFTDGNFLVGNGTEELEEITPDEVLSHINGASVLPISTAEYETLETEGTTNANTLYMLTDAEEQIVNYDSIDNYTIAFDANGKILWATSATSINGGEFVTYAPTAIKIVLSKNITNLEGAFAGHTSVADIYTYPNNEQLITDLFVGGNTGIREDGAEVYIHSIGKNYVYLIDLLVAIGVPVLKKEEVDEVTKAYIDEVISTAIGDAIGGSY